MLIYHLTQKILKKQLRFLKEKSDLIIGSKYLVGSRIIKRKAIRILCSKIYTFVCRLLISKNISDYSAGFRFYSIKSLNKLIKEKQRYKSPSQHLENLLFYYENKFNIDVSHNIKIPMKIVKVFI